MNIGEYIKYLRQTKKLSLNQLALYSNVSNAHISRIENGKRKPSPDILKKLSIHLDVSYEELLKKAGYLDDSRISHERLRGLREERQLLQKNIAKYLNISASDYGFYEQGKNTPDNETLKLLADFFKVSTEYLLGRSDIRKSYEPLTPDQELASILSDPEMHVAFQDYDSWTDDDKRELIAYLKAKKIARESKEK